MIYYSVIILIMERRIARNRNTVSLGEIYVVIFKNEMGALNFCFTAEKGGGFVILCHF